MTKGVLRVVFRNLIRARTSSDSTPGQPIDNRQKVA
jgi:hypothetical protein